MSSGDFRVADISLADFGRKEIELAEHEVFAYILIVLSFLLTLFSSDAWPYVVSS
jgi:S-adenosylhomocysteine hydrolase